eukprot:scaffold1182_cov124-Isochrysis_galbana.AAC.18
MYCGVLWCILVVCWISSIRSQYAGQRGQAMPAAPRTPDTVTRRFTPRAFVTIKLGRSLPLFGIKGETRPLPKINNAL